jgi:hypothetical protein
MDGWLEQGYHYTPEWNCWRYDLDRQRFLGEH